MTEQMEQMIYNEGRRRGREEATKELMEWHNRVCEEMAKRHTADRPKGEWTIRFVKEDNGMGGTYRVRRWYCSACSNWQTYGETDFCPNCGSDNRGEDNETDRH